MRQKVRDIMTREPVKLDGSAKLIEAARHMRQADVCAVLVEQSGALVGIVTDHDLVVRAVADGWDAKHTRLSEICSVEALTVSPDDDIDTAIELMQGRAARRVPVVDKNGAVVGILSFADLARLHERASGAEAVHAS